MALGIWVEFRCKTLIYLYVGGRWWEMRGYGKDLFSHINDTHYTRLNIEYFWLSLTICPQGWWRTPWWRIQTLSSLPPDQQLFIRTKPTECQLPDIRRVPMVPKASNLGNDDKSEMRNFNYYFRCVIQYTSLPCFYCIMLYFI